MENERQVQRGFSQGRAECKNKLEPRRTTVKHILIALGTSVIILGASMTAAGAGENKVIVEQYGNYNAAAAVQQGRRNFAHSYQKRNWNRVVTRQFGTDNYVVTGQDGYGNYALTYQRGRRNLSGTAQFGTGHVATTEQDGYDNVSGTIQVGRDQTAHTRQVGNGNMSLVIQGGGW
jgi:minor curlin subunit